MVEYDILHMDDDEATPTPPPAALHSPLNTHTHHLEDISLLFMINDGRKSI